MEELVNRYREIALVLRIAILAGLGLVVPAYLYLEEAESYEMEYESAKQQLSKYKRDFDKARQDVEKIPEKEEKIAAVQAELQIAKKKLPDDFNVADFIKKTSVFAEETNVKVLSYKPDAKPQEAGTTYRYEQLGINLSLEGTFENTTRFLDEIAHLDKMVHIEDIAYTGKTELPKEEKNKTEEQGDKNKPKNLAKLRKEQNAEAAALRANSFISATAKVILFRSTQGIAGGEVGLDGDVPLEGDPADVEPDAKQGG